MSSLLILSASVVALLLLARHRHWPFAWWAVVAYPLLAALRALRPEAVVRNAPDGLRYVSQAELIAEHGLSGLLQGGVGSGKELFPVLLYALSPLFEIDMTTVAQVNALLMAVGVLLVMPHGTQAEAASRRAVLCFALPLSVAALFFGTLPLREGAIVLAVAVHVRQVADRAPHRSMAPGLGALMFLRPIVGIACLAGLASRAVRRSKDPMKVLGRLAVAVVLLSLLAVITPPVRSAVMAFTPESILSGRRFNSQISSSGFPVPSGDSWGAVLAAFPFDLLRVLVRPNPLQDGSSAFLAASLDTVVMLHLLRRLLARGWVTETQRDLRSYGLGFTASLLVLYALTVADLGQLLRGRLALSVVLVVVWLRREWIVESSARRPTGRVWRGLSRIDLDQPAGTGWRGDRADSPVDLLPGEDRDDVPEELGASGKP